LTCPDLVCDQAWLRWWVRLPAVFPRVIMQGFVRTATDQAQCAS
jgi:hypothetical protein